MIKSVLRKSPSKQETTYSLLSLKEKKEKTPTGEVKINVCHSDLVHMDRKDGR